MKLCVILKHSVSVSIAISVEQNSVILKYMG
nr:MAG TPA: hypothetical protein [Caudoviricetes sp.]